jgi:hypothetical protein
MPETVDRRMPIDQWPEGEQTTAKASDAQPARVSP